MKVFGTILFLTGIVWCFLFGALGLIALSEGYLVWHIVVAQVFGLGIEIAGAVLVVGSRR